jgi:hypothetical protein
MSPKVQATKARIYKWDFIKLKSFTAKETINMMKIYPMEFGEIFANHTPEKRQIYKI